MATSGTVGSTTVAIDDLISEAALRCGKSTSDLTPEIAKSARFNLFSYLSNLSNYGVNLWCIEKSVIGLYVSQAAYSMPVGTVDVLNATYRTVNRPANTPASSSGGTAASAFDADTTTSCTQTAINGNISADFGVNATITTLGILPNATTSWNLVWEYSTDGATWTSVYAPGSLSYTAGAWSWADVASPASARYFRVRETGGGTLDTREVVFGTVQTEVVMARLNRDDYVAQPNKTQTGNPLQYWFDRQRTQPQMVLWPTPSTTFNTIVVWRHRHVQDVGSLLTNEVEIPQRWIEAVVSNLAVRMCMIFPQMDPNRIQLLGQLAEKYTFEASQEERDNSPVYLVPQIGVYTK